MIEKTDEKLKMVLVNQYGNEIILREDGMVAIGGGERKQVYKIITAKYEDLEAMVNKALTNGAVLVGGPLVEQGYFHQAILEIQ